MPRSQPHTDAASIGALWRTVRHLRPVQVWAKARNLLPRLPAPIGPTPALRDRGGPFGQPIARPGPIRDGSTFHFLNRAGRIDRAIDWNRSAHGLLWLYNLHYFDWLKEKTAAGRREEDAGWIERWITDNPAGAGTGWAPYPLSLRLVNWIVWLLTMGAASPQMIQSLAIQARHLERSLEYHILGNHLFVNAKALVFAGAFFDGKEAARWLELGVDLLEREIGEQILADGAHFERSPMYHALILEDVVDLLGLAAAYPALGPQIADRLKLTAVAARMSHWLARMRHPDGEIPYFNDAAFGIAPPPEDLLAYARGRGVAFAPTESPLTLLQPSGYAVLSLPPLFCVFDCGRVGPDYLPGHAHADTLSLELSVGLHRVISNSGTSTYVAGAEREWERSTAAHATVEIDGANSAEVWAAFRTGRRPNVDGLESGNDNDAHWAQCQHDGYRYLAGAPVHRRRLTMTAQDLQVDDTIEGGSIHTVKGVFPIHPGIALERTGERDFRLETPAGDRVETHIDGSVTVDVTTGRFATGFGAVTARPIVEWRWHGRLPLSVQTQFRVIA